MELDDKIRVLMIDDMPPICLLVKKILFRLGLSNIDTCHYGGDGWEKIEQAHLGGKPYGLLLCDWNMPESGLELLKRFEILGLMGSRICPLL